jgi:hypothetical protein
MLNKRITSLALAALTAASLTVPAFAAETTTETSNRALKVDGTYQAVDIAVVVPTTGTVVINPYALPVKIGTDSNSKDVKVSQQIVTKPLAIKNQSDVKLDINVSATATTKGSLMLATAPIADVKKDTKNDAFVYLAVMPTTLAGAKDATTVNDAAIADAYGKVTWTEYTATSTPANVLALKTTAVTKEKMGTLAAATLDNSGAFSEYTAGSIAFVGLSGQCAQAPTTAWTAKDGLTANIAFTFTPNTDTDSNSNSNNSNSNSNVVSGG